MVEPKQNALPVARSIRGVSVPTMLYGTAWKETATSPLTRLALRAGFRGVDTANQRKHYLEAGVGEALRGAVGAGELSLDDVFVQTKFTYHAGQDHRLPYDPSASLAIQVRQSLISSLEHLGVNVVDSYLLHGPMERGRWTAADREVWQAMESLHDEGLVRLLGASNMSLPQVEAWLAEARVPPAFLQNRCYADSGWDGRIRALCRQNDVVYQGFSLLTANAAQLARHAFVDLCRRTSRTPAQAVFGAAIQLGMVPLTGTTDQAHMQEDMAVYDLPPLSEDELDIVEQIGLA